MTTAQFLGYVAPAFVALLVAGAGWLKGHTAQKIAKEAQQRAENADAKAERALNGTPGP